MQRPPAQPTPEASIGPAPLPRVWTPSAQPSSDTRSAPAASPGGATSRLSDQPTQVDADWAASVSDWLVQHRTAPTDPRLRNVQGIVIIRFGVQPDGQVTDVTVLQSSGYRSLDRAAMAMVRGARLPPFPPAMTQPLQSVTVPIRYGLE